MSPSAPAPDPVPVDDTAMGGPGLGEPGLGGPSMGERLRERRKVMGMTLQQVADAAGLTAGFISQIERDLATPSITSLTNVAQVLDLDPGAFLAQPPDPGAATRQGNRPIWGIDTSKLGYERISSTFPGNVLRAVLIHEAPGHRTEPISHVGEELFFVLSGALTVEVGGEAHVLHPGDSIHFASTRVHSTWNHTAQVTTILHTCTMDVFGDTPRAHVPGGDRP